MSETIIRQFYTSFQQKDIAGLQSCYHDDVIFSDPVFQHLQGKQAMAMWHMLIVAGKDLQLTYSKVQAANGKGSCHWDATYTFSGSGRKVMNSIDAAFEFRDGKIIRHKDHFSLWKWSHMALGIPGFLLGWSPLLKNKIRAKAAENLGKFIAAHAQYQ